MRVIGLDISSHSVACVEVDTAFGRFEVRDTHEKAVEPFVMNPLSAAHQLLQTLSRKADKLVTVLPPEISTFRNLQIASKDRKAVKAALEFELEDDLPFEKEDLHYDSTTVSSSNQGSLVHVAAVKKTKLEAHLKTLAEYALDPEIITTETWAFRSLLTRLESKNANPEPILLIGLEQQKSFFYVHFKGRPVLYKEVSFGIRALEHHLSEKLGASPNEIQNWIRDIGVTGIDERVSTAIMDALETLVPELRQTELSARTTLKEPIEQILLTGDGALMPGLMNWFEGASQKRVALFRPLSQLSPAQVTYSEVSEVRYAKALALAMSTVPVDKLSPINLRKGTFAKITAAGTSPLDFIKKPLPYLLITMAVFLGTKTTEYNYYKSKIDDLDLTLKKAVKGYFNAGSDGAVRTYLADTDKLKKTVETDLAKQRELSKLFSANANSPLDFLKTVSQKIGKDTVVDMANFEVGMENTESYKENRPLKASVTFLVANAQIIAKLSDVLDRSFGLKKGNSEEVTVEGRKLLKVVFSGTLGGAK